METEDNTVNSENYEEKTEEECMYRGRKGNSVRIHDDIGLQDFSV